MHIYTVRLSYCKQIRHATHPWPGSGKKAELSWENSDSETKNGVNKLNLGSSNGSDRKDQHSI